MLSREMAIKLFREHWNMISDEYAKGSKENMWVLKHKAAQKIIDDHGMNIDIDNSCFLCEYIEQEGLSCKECPIDFGNNKYCMGYKSPYK